MSVGDGPSAVPPGWYPDPADDARLRRWDGHNWTQDVILNPDATPLPPQAQPAAPVPESAPPMAAPQSAPAEPQYAPPVIISAPTPPTAPAAPTAYPAPQTPNQPPAGQPVPASPAPSEAPPSESPPSESLPSVPLPPEPLPAETPPSAAPPAAPPVEAPPLPPTIPRPSPAVNQHPNPTSGPVSLPDWANLPGLTLPPDLSAIPGLEDDSVLPAPTFAEPTQRGLPALPVFEPPFIPQRPDVQDAGAGRTGTGKANHGAAAQPDAPYAPPPHGAQYDVPPPPGMAHIPAAGPLLPPSALVGPVHSVPTWSQLPPISPSSALPGSQIAPDQGSRSRSSAPEPELSSDGPVTLAAWLIGLLPLFQFVLIYLAFGVLNYALYSGMQWGILLAPAAFSLLFANSDRTKLANLGFASPSIPFAVIPPLYLIVRGIRTGRSSLGPLVLWIVFQAAAIAGILYLLPALLKVPIPPFG